MRTAYEAMLANEEKTAVPDQLVITAEREHPENLAFQDRLDSLVHKDLSVSRARAEQTALLAMLVRPAESESQDTSAKRELVVTKD